MKEGLKNSEGEGANKRGQWQKDGADVLRRGQKGALLRAIAPYLGVVAGEPINRKRAWMKDDERTDSWH